MIIFGLCNAENFHEHSKICQKSRSNVQVNLTNRMNELFNTMRECGEITKNHKKSKKSRISSNQKDSANIVNIVHSL